MQHVLDLHSVQRTHLSRHMQSLHCDDVLPEYIGIGSIRTENAMDWQVSIVHKPCSRRSTCNSHMDRGSSRSLEGWGCPAGWVVACGLQVFYRLKFLYHS